MYATKEKRSARDRKWYSENKDKEKLRKQQYYQNNKEKILERSKQYYQNNKEKIIERTKRNINPIKKKENELKRLYNMTLEDWKLQHEIQAGKCAICEVELDILCVDHCHDTGKVRGLLCQKCNTGLGMLGDNLKNIERAYLYMLIANDNSPPTEQP